MHFLVVGSERTGATLTRNRASGRGFPNRVRDPKSLDQLAQRLEYAPLTTVAMRLAADRWAQARNVRQPTAPDPAIDADVILPAQALSLNTAVVVATGNPGQPIRFVPAELWATIAP
jgi:hypothetical protein